MYGFSKPTQFKSDLVNFKKLMLSSEFCSSDGYFYSDCQDILKRETQAKEVFITPSSTSALKMMAQIIECEPGDEVILP